MSFKSLGVNTPYMSKSKALFKHSSLNILCILSQSLYFSVLYIVVPCHVNTVIIVMKGGEVSSIAALFLKACFPLLKAPFGNSRSSIKMCKTAKHHMTSYF